MEKQYRELKTYGEVFTALHNGESVERFCPLIKKFKPYLRKYLDKRNLNNTHSIAGKVRYRAVVVGVGELYKIY